MPKRKVEERDDDNLLEERKEKQKYQELVEELENEITFPILLYQTVIFRESIYTKIEELGNKNKIIYLGKLFYTREAKVLLNEMMEYWGEKEGYLKALERIDKAMRKCVEYNDIDGEKVRSKVISGLPDDKMFSDYNSFLTAKNKELLATSFANSKGYDNSQQYILSSGAKVVVTAEKAATSEGTKALDMSVRDSLINHLVKEHGISSAQAKDLWQRNLTMYNLLVEKYGLGGMDEINAVTEKLKLYLQNVVKKMKAEEQSDI